MLAGKLEALDQVRYPVWATPKLDGIRCLIVNGVAVSRKLKPIPNRYIREKLAGLPEGLDGELIVPDASFQETTSAVMSHEGTPHFEYVVFDWAADPGGGYKDRMWALDLVHLPSFCVRLFPTALTTEAQLLAFEQRALSLGYEGVMLRSGDGPYKYGRSTVREGYLLKLKRFEDSEATVIGFEEKLRNENELERDALGHAKRSHAKAGMVPAGTLGALRVRRPDGVEFSIGSGFTDEFRARCWAERDTLCGRLVKYRHQPHGALDAPRFPVFIGFRHPEDL
jgi:DNA ligase-1